MLLHASSKQVSFQSNHCHDQMMKTFTFPAEYDITQQSHYIEHVTLFDAVLTADFGAFHSVCTCSHGP